MPTPNRHQAALLLLAILGAFVSCKTAGGPFVTISITGIPAETMRLVSSAVLGDTTRPAETSQIGDTTLPLTIALPPGARGSLVVSTQAMGASCTLAKGVATIELTDDIPYEDTLTLVAESLASCTGLNTVGLTLKRMESGGVGTVSSNPLGINCISDCTEQTGRYRPGTAVTLIARPALGSRVVWSEASCSGYRVCTVKVDKDIIVTATFMACAKGAWCDEGSPDVTSDLYGVWGTATSTVYAVGDGGKILLRNASQWGPMTSGVTTALRAIGGDKVTKAVYAGGDSGTLLNLTGTLTWTPVAEPLVTGKQITGIAGEYNGLLGPNSMIYLCTAEGDFISKAGNMWSLVPDNALKGKVLHGVSAENTATVGREATVAGDAGFVLRWTKTAIGQQTADNTSGSMATMALRGIWSGGSITVAVGDGGTIITRGTGDYGNGSKIWKRITSPAPGRLTAVWGADDRNIWIVGDGGVIMKYDGNTTVTMQTNVPPVDLTGVWAGDTNIANVYAVGRNGVILHYVP